MCLDEKIKLKRIVGRGPVKGSLFNEDLSLHGTVCYPLACIALGVDGVVHMAA